MSERKLIYTPLEHIPIGEPLLLPGGGHGLRLKRKRKSGEVTETVSLDSIHELIAESVRQDSP